MLCPANMLGYFAPFGSASGRLSLLKLFRLGIRFEPRMPARMALPTEPVKRNQCYEPGEPHAQHAGVSYALYKLSKRDVK